MELFAAELAEKLDDITAQVWEDRTRDEALAAYERSVPILLVVVARAAAQEALTGIVRERIGGDLDRFAQRFRQAAVLGPTGFIR